MVKIAPSLLACDFAILKEEVTSVRESGADLLHFDVMDGQFVPNISVGLPILESLRKVTDMTIDTHLMIENPEQMIDLFCEAGSDMVSVHYEATNHIHRAIQQIKSHNKLAGVVINPGTPVESLFQILQDVDFVLIMTVNPGFGGQGFIDSTLDKITWLDHFRKNNNLNFEIEVDGGINDQTGKLCVDQGADILVAGSYYFNHDDYNEPVRKLKGE
ncbi:ribulose-phosphate 3-epimerase [Mammaliicoccus vitulinus]|uniref:ribulose-phosphate 3-epimerase n=1 Tax=Mammaliicoccus vitulinus TaxID=71237 RepID=UPI000301DD47|nr:ribulose-phosphate 3-epimerase [Mammaliicoccus vitulinus]MBM6628697.1 ribulose-phosphate 3-epimerase [Mammaliicoccus vitulinus]MBO3076826.1 ribulose-phosphate 3-epimerase [Mammaliicoccus vitulinus]QJF24871.1 ribulose-phosphate 3-epimerase [Mammaliicoccus vitulinus]RIN16981.1 ribulose-phosphate 3-epimerase [Mammaliicoccus vitulinus]WQK86995.1 ribulose-phosphate 3-epimerase [Mammaliicoccus vitulinus]